MIKIELVEKNNEFEWDHFVNLYVNKEYGFTLKWRDILKEVFGYEAFYYLIRESEKVIGIFPIFVIKSSIFDDRLISIPFTDMGGFYFMPLVKDTTKVETFYKIVEKLQSDTKLLFKAHLPLEIRGPSYESNDFLLRYCCFTKTSPYVKFVINLNTSWENIEHVFSRNIKRNLVKTKGQLQIDICKDIKWLPDVYDIYLKEMRRLGSPPLPIVFFEKLWHKFIVDEGFVIFTVSYKNKKIGAISLIIFNDTVYADLIMSDARYNYLFPKYHLYFKSLEYAWNNKKYNYYDFNRTRWHSGVFEHKRRWGGKLEEIHYFYHGIQQSRSSFFDPSQKKFMLMGNILKYCPLSLLKLGGRHLRKQIGK